MFFLSRLGFLSNISHQAIVTLPGYWTEAPSILIGVADMCTYSPTYPLQNQIVQTSIVSSLYAIDGTCTAVPSAQLVLSGGTTAWSITEQDLNHIPVRFKNETYTYITSTFAQANATRITINVKAESACSGLYYKKNNVLAYWKRLTIALHYAPAGSGFTRIVLHNKQLRFGVAENIILTHSFPQSTYTFKVEFLYTTMEDTYDYMPWSNMDVSTFLGASITIGGGTSLYSGKVHILGAGR